MRERTAHLAIRLGPPIGVGLVLGVLGPFGTFDRLAALPRVGYWVAVVSVNWLLADAIVRRVETLTQVRLPLPRLFVPLLGGIATAFPATGIVALAGGLSGLGWPGNVPVLFGQVLLLMCAITLPAYTFEDMRERIADQPNAQPSEAPNRGDERQPAGGFSLFAARFPKPLEGRLLCLEMQDHYLVVHHSGGSEMILCRMEDAARELNGLGRRVHRSWWVATEAVAGAEREGQRSFLRLIDGRRVPVGRSCRPDLRAAGWI